MVLRKKGKKVLIIAGGEVADPRLLKRLAQACEIVICADGGYFNAMKARIKPDILIGDLDSKRFRTNKRVGSRLKTIKYPRMKDSSDTELALVYSAEILGASEMIVAGALGKRIDHALANISTIGKYPGKARIVDDFCELTVYDRSFSVKGRKGETVSLLPFFSSVKIGGSKGLQYPLKGITLKEGSLGISNVMTKNRARVSFGRGKVLFIRVFKV